MKKVKDYIKNNRIITLIDFDGEFISASDVDRDFRAYENEEVINMEEDNEGDIILTLAIITSNNNMSQ